MATFEKSKAKTIVSDKNAINKIVFEAINKMADIIGATIGPAGRPVLIERDGLSPLVTKDGVTVAKSLGVDNADVNVIIEAAKEICIKTATQAGDGTSTAIVLAAAIVKYGQEFLKTQPKYNPQRVINELNDLYRDLVVPYLKDNAIESKSEEQLRAVAKISANGDKKIAEAAVRAVIDAGDDGTVLLEEGQGIDIKVDTISGYIVTSGLRELGSMGPVFINDRANQQVKMDKGHVFLYDGSMNDLKIPGMIQDILEALSLAGDPLIIFAHDFSDTVLSKLGKTCKGGINIIPIKTPMSGIANGRSMFLHDMAAYSGGTVYDPGNIDILKDIPKDVFGSFINARCNMYETFIKCNSDSTKIDKRVEELKSIVSASFNQFDKMHLKAAISKLTGGVSTIWIGGMSDLEIREKKHRVEDAVEAVRSAIAEGIVPGGASILLKLASMIEEKEDKPQSWNIMKDAFMVPFTCLIHNCGEEPEEVRKGIMFNNLPSQIFDANKHEYVCPFKAEIIEPSKVIRVAVGNALSVAGLLITLGGLVTVPRDSNLENQLALTEASFKNMMSNTGMGQE